MQPTEGSSSTGAPQQSSQPVEGRSRGGIGSFFGKVAGVAGIEVKPTVKAQETISAPVAHTLINPTENHTESTQKTPSVPEVFHKAFEQSGSGALDPTMPPAPHPEELIPPTNPKESDVSSEIQNTVFSSDSGVSVEPSHVVEDPGIPMTAPIRAENPGETPEEPQVVAVASEEGKSMIQPDAGGVDEISSSEAHEALPIEVKKPISFLKKWLLRHNLPNYVNPDGSIDDAKLARDATNPGVLREAGMSDEIVTLVGAIEARGVEIDEMVEAGIEEVYKRDQQEKNAA